MDTLSTLMCMAVEGDWRLAAEFNPLLRGTSIGRMALHAALAFICLFGIYLAGRRARRRIYPGEGFSYEGFWDHVLGCLSGRLPPGRSGAARQRAWLTVLAIVAPMVVAMGHYRVAVTNMLQAWGLMTWPSLAVLLVVRAGEVVAYVGLASRLIYHDYRARERSGTAGQVS